MDIIEIYKSILNTGGMKASDDGLVSVQIHGDPSPVLIDGKRLALPTQNNLSDASVANKIIFHPLRESPLRSESEIVQYLRKTINIRINYTLGAIAQNLLSISASIEDHHKLSPDQQEILSVLKDADATTVNNFTKLMIAAVKESPEKAFINIYLKKGGTVNDHKYSRAGIVTFPLYEELLKQEDKIHGVTIRGKDKKAFIALFEYILPGLDKQGKYNVGSDSQVAPYMDSLMRTVMGVASRINDILDKYGKFIDSAELLVFDAEWTEAFTNLDDLTPLIRQIPMQAGNEGKSGIVDTPVTPTPLHMPQPVPQQQPVFNQPVQQFNQQAAFNMQPQQQPPAGILATNKGLNWESVMRSKGIGMQPGMRGPMMGMQQPMQGYGMQQPQQPTRFGQPAGMYGAPQPMYGNQGFSNQGFSPV